MINLFLTYQCNLNCSYCFAAELAAEFPGEISRDAVSRISEWIETYGISSIGLLGGEPTMHSDIDGILESLRKAGVMISLFTNALFPRRLADTIVKTVSNVVVNYNPPRMYTRRQLNRIRDNLDALKSGGCRISFSKNFSSQYREFDYLLDACAVYGVRHIRYDISRPSLGRNNDFFDLESTRDIVDTIFDFATRCRELGIASGLDCCVPLCYFTPERRSVMKAISSKFSGICHPSIDIHPDLSASYCLPMRHICVDDVTAFAGEDALLEHFSHAVRRIRFENAFPLCNQCDDFRIRCQGGCLALRGAEHSFAAEEFIP